MKGSSIAIRSRTYALLSSYVTLKGTLDLPVYLTSINLLIQYHCVYHNTAMSVQASQARSLYRRILRELPARSPSILANPSPIQQHVRGDFEAVSNDAQTSIQLQSQKPQKRRLEEAEQFAQYLKAQRMYTTLLERYNPGMNMSEEDRVRLTARRVGMDLPIEMMQSGGGSKK